MFGRPFHARARPPRYYSTYDEKENVEDVLTRVFALQPEFHVLVVDDGSPDGTAAIVKDLMARWPGRLHLMERKGKLGLGTAYIAGFKWALERNYAFIFEMDADLSHNPDDLVRLYHACAVDGVGMTVGSRYVRGGSVRDWAWHRIMISWCASLYVRTILWLGVMDTTAGFVCYRNTTLAQLDLGAIKFIGYAFQIEMKYRVKRKGLRIVEVPITFIDRVKGKSKMSMNIFKEAFIGVIRMRFTVKR
ncbi:MAG: polyprenol monophosphomannose synthase [Flavobacteriales bacterium]|nr:polyprenol monophosphomannose synthase [Flavobacteriales bacterium]